MNYNEAIAQLIPEDKQYGIEIVTKSYFNFVVEKYIQQCNSPAMTNARFGKFTRTINGMDFDFYTVNGVIITIDNGMDLSTEVLTTRSLYGNYKPDYKL